MLEIVSLIGLSLIVAAWTMQLMFVLRKQKEINRNFVALYTIGVVVLTIGGSNRGLDFMAILNIASAIVAVLVYLKLK